ncbi:hypothetical protein V5N11_004480 [Cardamine amara subsp. amara]|uniref:Transcription elongation factor TFIIS/CRSP70 N-terminal sub-type domain-containing protein n=1 Tax=Cardamine amara subsp. amara TaxID=228776 RepID=A0ABD1C3D5_CARAN
MKMMRVRIAKERYDLSDYASFAINATYNSRDPSGVDRCIEALIHLKSLSFSFKEFTQFSESISKLETLRRHRNPMIRKEAHALFDSWMKTLYAHGRDRETDKVKKEAKIGFLMLKHKGEHRSETCEEKQTNNNNLKPLNLKRRRVGSEDAISKKPRGAVTNIAADSSIKKTDLDRSVITTAPSHHSRQNIKDTNRREFTTKTLIPPPRRDAARKNVSRCRPLAQAHTSGSFGPFLGHNILL